GLLDHPAQPALGMGPEVGPDPVGGVDVQAVQGEPAGRTAAVHGQLEEGQDQVVAGDQQVPVRRHVGQRDAVRMVGPGAQLTRGGIDRVGESPEDRLLRTHVIAPGTNRATSARWAAWRQRSAASYVSGRLRPVIWPGGVFAATSAAAATWAVTRTAAATRPATASAASFDERGITGQAVR